MPRQPRNPLFKKTDFDRLVEAARKKNLPIHRIDATRDGLSLVVGEPVSKATTPAASDEIELDAAADDHVWKAISAIRDGDGEH